MGKAGQALRTALETHGISQNRLAVTMGVDRAVVSRWVRELTDPSAQSVVEIQNALQHLAPEAAKVFIQLYIGNSADSIATVEASTPVFAPQPKLSDQPSTYSRLKPVKSNQPTLGQKLRERRESLGLTRLQVARACDVVESTVINWETNRHKPKLYPAQMKALCEILKFSLQDLSE